MAQFENLTSTVQNSFADRVPRMFWNSGKHQPQYVGIILIILPIITGLVIYRVLETQPISEDKKRYLLLLIIVAEIAVFYMFSRFFVLF